MAIVTTYALKRTTVVNSSTTAIFYPATDFMDVAGIGNVRASIEVRARFGTALICAGFQTANDKLNPDTAVAIPIENDAQGGYADADGVWFVNSALTPVSSTDKTFIRYGFMIKLVSGTNGGGSVVGGVQGYR